MYLIELLRWLNKLTYNALTIIYGTKYSLLSIIITALYYL